MVGLVDRYLRTGLFGVLMAMASWSWAGHAVVAKVPVPTKQLVKLSCWATNIGGVAKIELDAAGGQVSNTINGFAQSNLQVMEVGESPRFGYSYVSLSADVSGPSKFSLVFPGQMLRFDKEGLYSGQLLLDWIPNPTDANSRLGTIWAQVNCRMLVVSTCQGALSTSR
jgi:hypothetical protein